MKKYLALVLALAMVFAFAACGTKETPKTDPSAPAADPSVNPLSNPKVRQAISMSIDRQVIVETVTKAGEIPAMAMVPPGLADPSGTEFREKAGNYYLKETAQVEEALALLAEAGYPNGEGIPEVELLYNTSENHKAVAEAVQQMVSKIGIKVKLTNQEWKVFAATRTNVQYSGLCRHGWIGDYADPQTFLDMYMSVGGAANKQSSNGYVNPAYDEVMAKALAAQGQERFDYMYEAEKILMEDAFVIPINYYVNKAMVNPAFTGWTLGITGKLWFGDASFSDGRKDLIWNMGAEPETLDPQLASSVTTQQVVNHTFEGLYRDKDTNVLEPALAKDHTEVVNEDGTVTYTFNLRDGIKWSDGQPITANDFVYAWQRAVDPAVAAEYSYMLMPIKNATEIIDGTMPPTDLAVRAVDDKTFEVILKAPCDYFLSLTGFQTFMPVRSDMVDNDGIWANTPAKAVSSGPYVLTEYVMGSHLVLAKNPHYWNAANVSVETIRGEMIVEPSSMLSAFKSGNVDFIDNPPAEEIPQLIASGELQIFPYLGTYFILVNATL